MRLPPALRYRDFRLFTIGYLPAETGEYIHFVVQNWLAWELTRSAFALGLLGFCEFAPRFVFGPIGGVVADRVDRLKLLKISRIANLIHSLSALALSSATHNLTKVIGPSIGGVLLTVIGPGPCILIQALTVVGMLFTLWRMQSAAEPANPAKGDWLKDIVEGISYLRENRRVFSTILTTYSNGFFGISYAQFLPYFAQEVLHVGPAGYGVLVSAPGVGAVLISFFLSTHARLRGMRRLLVGASLIYAVAIFLFALSPFYFLSIILLAIVGSMQMSYRVLARAIIQEECPDHMMGRAMSLFFLDRGFGSLGAIGIGSMAALMPVPIAVAASALACGLVSWILPKAANKPHSLL